MAFFFVAIVDELKQLALTGPRMIQDTPQNIFSQIELDTGWHKEWYSQKSCFFLYFPYISYNKTPQNT